MTATTVTEKPMLFSGPMVRAILEGRKTQTRRVMKPQPPEWARCAEYAIDGRWWFNDHPDDFTDRLFWPDLIKPLPCPHPVGSRIWVRETMIQRGTVTNGRHNRCYYKADNTYVYDSCAYYDDVEQDRTIASIHMPRWASRITLEVTDVRVQRLQEISEEDARDEGVDTEPVHWDCCYLDAFVRIWNSIHGPDAWEQNPWVWAYTFRRVEGGES